MTTRAQLIAAARSHLGTRFHHQGRAPGAGLDCIGLVVVSARASGVEVLDQLEYSRQPDGLSLVDKISKSLDGPFPVESMREGTILLMEFVDGLPQHVGIATDIGIIHAIANSPRRVIETRLDATWRSRIISCWELRGLED